MNVDLPRIAQFLEKSWYKKSGLAGALISIGLSVGFILATAGAIWWASVGVLVTSWSVVCVFWYHSIKIPKTKKNHIGFVTSIYCGDDEESRRIREDFIIPLRRLMRSTGIGQTIHFIEIPQHLASQDHDAGHVEKLAITTKAHFILYGRVRERVLLGKEYHVIELDGLVSHKPVPEAIQQRFAREFAELLPRRLNIAKENDLLSFQFTSEWASLVAQYIIGIAAFMSGDLDCAEGLFRDALKQLESKSQRFSIYAKLVERIPIRISQLCEVRAGSAHRAWCDTREQKFIDEVGKHLEKVGDESRSETGVLLLSAVHAFVKYRDTEKALRYLKRIKGAAKGSTDSKIVAVWNYNVAFLNAYNGDLKVAIKHYRRAAMIAVEPDIIDQVEGFLCWVLEQEPEKYQINFCLGFFNWRTKGDVIQAEKDFDKFLKARRDKEFEREKGLVEKWLVGIRS